MTQSQAVPTTYFGKDRSSGVSNDAPRLKGAMQAAISFELDAGNANPQTVGTLSGGVFVTDVINHDALAVGTTIDIDLEESSAGAGDGIALATGLDATSASINDASDIGQIAEDRKLVVTVNGGTAGETAVLSLLVVPVVPGWS